MSSPDGCLGLNTPNDADLVHTSVGFASRARDGSGGKEERTMVDSAGVIDERSRTREGKVDVEEVDAR
jgi:hypothetical protein